MIIQVNTYTYKFRNARDDQRIHKERERERIRVAEIDRKLREEVGHRELPKRNAQSVEKDVRQSALERLKALRAKQKDASIKRPGIDDLYGGYRKYMKYVMKCLELEDKII